LERVVLGVLELQMALMAMHHLLHWMSQQEHLHRYLGYQGIAMVVPVVLLLDPPVLLVVQVVLVVR
jgi:hypothetical protein